MARDHHQWLQEQAEREILDFIRSATGDSHILRIIKDGQRWVIAKSRLSEPACVGEGGSFGQAWFEASGSTPCDIDSQEELRPAKAG